MMKRTFSAVYILAALAGFYYAYTVLEPDLSWPHTPSYSLLALLILAQLGYWLLAALSWGITLKACSSHSLSLFESLLQVGVTALGKYIPGKVWGVLARSVRITGSLKGSASVWEASVIEQIAVLHTGTCLGTCLFLAFSSTHFYAGLAALLSLASVPIASFFIRSCIAFLAKRTQREEQKFEKRSYTVIYCKVFIAYFILWLAAGLLMTSVTAFFLNREVTLHLCFLCIAANAFGGVAGFLALFAPSGLGVRELASGLLLQFSFSPADVFLIVVWFRLWILTADLLLGLLTLFYKRQDSPA